MHRILATLAFLAFAIAASAILPTIVYSLFWRGFTARGALLSLYGGLATSVLLVVFSPVVSSSLAVTVTTVSPSRPSRAGRRRRRCCS